MKTKLLNFALYQGGWFSCVFGAADGYPWLGAFAAFFLIAVHSTLAADRQAEWVLVLVIGLLGTIVDSFLMSVGIFEYGSGQWVSWLCPVWMSVMWMQFATLLRFSIDWLSGRYFLAATLGAIGGPLAYASGIRLGAASFGVSEWVALPTLAIVWAIVTPGLLMLEYKLRPANVKSGYRM